MDVGWFKDRVTFQIMLWSFIAFAAAVGAGGIITARSALGLVTGVFVAGLGAGAMILGLEFTRIWLGLFYRKDRLRATRIAAALTGAIFMLIGAGILASSLSASRLQ